MHVAFKISVTDFNLEGRITGGVGLCEEIGKITVGKMKVEAAGIGFDAIASPTQ